MKNWYEHYDVVERMNRDPEYKEKLKCEDDRETKAHKKNAIRRKREDAWSRKRSHKKKMVRRFLSMNPAMDYSEFGGTSRGNGIYVSDSGASDGKYRNARTQYCMNPYTKVYLSPRGDLRVYHGNVSYIRGSFTLVKKDKMQQKLTNKRIRMERITEESGGSYSYKKKLFGPEDDDLW